MTENSPVPSEPGGNLNHIEQRPTNIRWLVVLSATLMSILLYLDRFCYSFAERFITEDLGLTNHQSSLIQGVFFLTYAIGQVPAGWLGDRFGARWMLTIYILVWSLFTGLIGLATSFAALILLRAGLGIGQAGAYPVSGATVARWIPLQSRGLASSFVACGGRLGGFIAPVLTGLLIVMFVPVTTSSEIATETIKDPLKFSARLATEAGYLKSPAKASAPVPQDEKIQRQTLAKELASKRVFTFLPEPAQRVVIVAGGRKLAEEVVVKKGSDGKEISQENKPSPPMSERDQQILVDGLNFLLKQSDFYSAGIFPETPLGREANAIFERREKGEELSEAEVTRLNRHVLEGIYPEHFHKIYSAGWRPMMMFYGCLGIFVAGLFWLVVRNSPTEHPFCNQAERELIAPSGSAKPAPKSGLERPPFAALICSKNMWFNSISQVGTNIGWVFILTWFPRYLADVHHVPIIQRAVMVSIPLGTSVVGMLLGGRWTDWLIPRVGLKWGRRIPWSATKVVAVIAFLMCVGADNPWRVTIALSIVTAFTDLGVGSAWAFAQDVGGRHVGSVLGWGNMWGNIGAACSPPLLNWVIEQYGWNANFLTCALAFTVSGVVALGVDATKPLFPTQEKPIAVDQ